MSKGDDELLLENLTPANIHQIAWEIREKTHDTRDARRLLHKYCQLFDDSEAIPYELLRHLRDAFKAFLDTENVPGKAVAIDTALGLTPGVKRDSLNDQKRSELSIELWWLRLNGASYQEARATVANKFGIGKTRVGEIWAANKHDSLIQLRLQLRIDGTDFSPEQVEKAEKILEKDQQVISKLLGR